MPAIAAAPLPPSPSPPPSLSPRLVELHLSHNQMGTAGVKTLLAAVPCQRPQGLRPLWFRVEYNQINPQDLADFIQQVRRMDGALLLLLLVLLLAG